jgi:hypothetical protein
MKNNYNLIDIGVTTKFKGSFGSSVSSLTSFLAAFKNASWIVVFMTLMTFSFVQRVNATTCPSATVITPSSLPINNANIVCGSTDDINAVNLAASALTGGLSTNYLGGQESVYSFTPTSTSLYTLSMNGQAWSQIAVFNGCPTTAGTTCLSAISSSATAKSINVTLTAGVTYFIVFDTWPTPDSPCPGTFSLFQLVPNTATASAIGGLWSSSATWGSLPNILSTAVIPAGSIVTVDQVVTCDTLIVNGTLQWNATANAMTANVIIINATGKFLPYTTAAGGTTGVTLNIAKSFTNNGYANLAVGTTTNTYLNFNGASSVLTGTGVFEGDGTRGIIRQLFFQNLGANTISTTQNLTCYSFAHTAGSLNTNGKLRIDNTARIYGQAINTQVASIPVTAMGTGYTVAPVVFGSAVTPKPLTGALTTGTRYFSGNNVYLCTTGGAISSVAAAAGWGLANTTTFTDSLATLLWTGFTGTIGNPFITTAPAVGTQYFYGNNLYTAVLATAPGTVPPTHTSGTVGSFMYAGSPAKVTVNYDATTQTVRSLTLGNAGSGYSSATAPTVSFSVGAIGATGSGAAATASILYAIFGPLNSVAQRTASATITGGLSINSDQGASIASSDIQASSGVGALYTTNGGVNYTVAPQVGISGPTALNLVTNAGSGYTTAPTITVAGGTQPVGAAALTSANFTITVNQGKVVSFYLTGTNPYITPPTITLTGGGGTGATVAFPANCWATATPVLGSNGQVTNFTITNPGFGYVVAPTCAFGNASATPTGGTYTTAATAPTARVALYNLTLALFAPATTAVVASDDAIIPASRKINVLTLSATGNGLTLADNLTLYGTAPLSLAASSVAPGNIIDLGTKTLTCSWNGYSGSTSSTFGATNTYIKNGSMVLVGRGGGISGSTFNFPFSGTVTWFSGSGTATTNGSTILTVKVSDLGAPSNVNATGTAIPTGARAFKIETASTLAAAPQAGTNPTVKLNFNSQDNLTATQNTLFLADGAALNGPWNVRSAVYGAATTALPATGTITTATVAPGPVTITGNDFYAWAFKTPTITSVTPTSLCASSGFFTLKGTSLLGVSAVSIAGAAVNSFTVVADTMITGYVGAGTTGVATVTKNGTTVSGVQTITLIAAPAAPTVAPVSATVALGETPSFTASGTSTGTYAWYNTFTGGTPLATGATYTTLPRCATGNLFVAINDGTCEGARFTIPITVNPMPTLSSTTPTFCGTGGTTTLSLAPSYTGLTYTWSSLTPSATLSTTTGTSTSATLSVTSNFKLKVSNNGCADSSFISIGVYPLPSATVTTTASGVCPGTSATIGSGLSAGNFTVSSIPYVPYTVPANAGIVVQNGAAVAPFTLGGGTYDDGGFGNIPIGFNFNYFGNTYSTVSASTNGTLMFGTVPCWTTGAGCLGQFFFNTTGGVFPNTNNPGNVIALMAGDYWFGGGTSKIKYWVEGYAPNRKFIILYENVHNCCSATNATFTAYATFYETLGIVDISILNKGNTNSSTVGLQDATKTIGAVAPGRQAFTSTITTPEAWRFAPPSNYTTTWNSIIGSTPTQIATGTNIFSQTVAPAVTTTYDITYTNQTTGCTNAPNSAQVQMLVLGTVAPANVSALAADSSVCWGQADVISLDYTGLPDGLTFQWEVSTDAGTTWTDIAGATAISYTAYPQTPSMYRCRIASCNGTPVTSAACSVALNATAGCYCVVPTISIDDEDIKNVTIGSLNNSSDCITAAPGQGSLVSRYANYTTGTGAPTAPGLEKCLPIPFSVLVGSCGIDNWSSGLAIFIDYNQNGLFTDAGEKVYSNGATANIACVPATTVSGNITIPNTALNGLTRMRIINAEFTSGNSITPCGNYFYGEVEDYMVNILPLAACPSIAGLSVVNITNNDATLNWNVGCNTSTNYDIIYTPQNGTPVVLDNVLVTITNGVGSFDVSNLIQSTNYSLDLRADCGTDSSNTLTTNFVTYSNCKNPFALTMTSDVDSIFGTWQWQSWDTTLYQVTGFNFEYGINGYTQGTGTFYAADANFTDSIIDANLLGGGVYSVYIQSVCGVDSSLFVGPFSVTMPLSNDSVCGAEMLTVNGPTYVFNNVGASVQPNENNIAPPVTGAQATDGWIASTLNGTTWFTFVAPSSGNMRINCTSSVAAYNNFNGQVAVYSNNGGCTDFANFTLNSANDNAIGGTSVAPNYTVCGLTPGATYYILFDHSGTAGTYSLKLTSIDLEAGTLSNVINVCTGDAVNLFTGITGNQSNGVWTAELASAATGLTDSTFQSAGLAFQTFNFEYRLTDGCAYDSVIGKVKIYPPSSAGADGTLTVCRNQPVDLLFGLGGNVDFGGQWRNPSNAVLPQSQINSSNIPGQYNYSYISGNGVCPNDTANVLLNVLANCNWLSLDEEANANMTIMPNPTTGIVYLKTSGSTETYTYQVLDLEGRLIEEKVNSIVGNTQVEINLTGKEVGVYLIRVFNDNADKVYRIVLQ